MGEGEGRCCPLTRDSSRAIDGGTVFREGRSALHLHTSMKSRSVYVIRRRSAALFAVLAGAIAPHPQLSLSLMPRLHFLRLAAVGWVWEEEPSQASPFKSWPPASCMSEDMTNGPHVSENMVKLECRRSVEAVKAASGRSSCQLSR